MSVDENHPVFTCLKKLVNDPMLDRECFQRICNARVFKWVAAYVITDAGRILVMELPKKSRKAKNIQTFGGSVYGSEMTSEWCNFFYAFVKLRSELMDESSIDLSTVEFEASPLIVIGDGLVQVIRISDDWVVQQRLWCPERARNHGWEVHRDISAFWVRLKNNASTMARISRKAEYQLVKLRSVEEMRDSNGTGWKWRQADGTTFFALDVVIDAMSSGSSFFGKRLLVHESASDACKEWSNLLNGMLEDDTQTSMREFVNLGQARWTPILKFQALPLCEYSFIVALFQRTAQGQATGTEAAPSTADGEVERGSLCSVWLGTCWRAQMQSTQVALYESHSAALTDHDVLQYAVRLTTWFTNRGMSREALSPGSIVDDAIDADVRAYGGRWLKFNYNSNEVRQSPELSATARVSYHGTWCYSAPSILRTGRILSSNDHSKGHDFTMPGVYSSPKMDTALGYCRSGDFFNENILFAIIFQVRSAPDDTKKNWRDAVYYK